MAVFGVGGLLLAIFVVSLHVCLCLRVSSVMGNVIHASVLLSLSLSSP